MTNAYYDLLAETVETMNARIQEEQIESMDCDKFHDVLHEVVDSAVPIRYKEIFEVMAADGIDIEFDDSGLIPDTKDVTVILQARIYEALYNDVQSDSGLVWFEEEKIEGINFYVMNDNDVVLIICHTLEEAKEEADNLYKEDGACYHVEGIGCEWLYHTNSKEEE